MKQDDVIFFDSSKEYENIPRVVITGRPNVGKSTLFNRFLHTRLAITDPTPGATRDKIEKQAFLSGYPVLLTDTGGFKLDRKEGTKEAELDEIVVCGTVAALKGADRILLLLDAEEITGEDEEFIGILRPFWNKVVAAVNKTEGGRLSNEACDFYRFGFPKLFFISAEHGDNISDLAAELVRNLDFSQAREKEDFSKISVAVMGKPNTGKSTLCNRLTHSERSIVSDYAGTTRDVVEGDFTYRDRHFHILDTAGIRRKKKVEESLEYYSVNRAIKTLDAADLVFHLIDVKEGLTEQDKKIAALACERGCGVIFVLNKWDTLDLSEGKFSGRQAEKQALKSIKNNINVMFGHMEFAPILPICATEGTGIKDLLDEALNVYDQLTRKIETSALNTALRDWTVRKSVPTVAGKRVKLRYAVQQSVNPAKFLFFCTHPDDMPESYTSYLKNRIRNDLGLEKIPILIEYKASRKKREEL